MLIFIKIDKSIDWVVLCWQHAHRESGMVETACAQHKAFPQELLPENIVGLAG